MKLFRILILSICVTALISCGGAEERKAVYLEKARNSMAIGDYDKARIELKNVLQIDPKYAEAYYQLGKVYEKQKEYRKAFTHYLKAEELNPEHLDNLANLGRIYLLMANEADKAQEKIDFILSKDPENSGGLLLKAAMLLKNEKREESIEIVENILQKDPGHTESLVFLTSLYLQDAKLSEAKIILEDALKLNADDEQVNKLLALVLVKNKEFDRAEKIYTTFLERNPDSVKSYNNLAAFYNESGDKDKAEETLRASVKNDNSDVDRKVALIRYIKSVKGDDAAISELKKMVDNNKGMGELRTALAELFYINEDKQSAIEVYKQAISDFPEEVTGVNSRIALASIYINDKDYIAADKIVGEAIEVSPNDPKVNFILAKLALQNKDIEQAIISLRIVTKETPENIEAFLLLANIYKIEGNTEQINSTLKQAYDQNKTNPEALLVLAKVHLASDAIKAEKIIDDYNAVKENDYEGLSIKAAILNQKKQFSEANEIAEKLMELFPDKANGYLQSIPYLSSVKDKESALANLEKGYLSVEDNRKILVLLTTLQAGEKQFDVVEKRLHAEIKANPEDAELKVLLSKVYIAEKKLTHAEKILEEAIANNSSNEEPYLLLSQLYQSNNKPDKSKSILISGIDSIPNSIKISVRLSSLYELDQSYVKAIEVYKSLNEAYPDKAVVVNNYASLLSDYGNGGSDLELAKTLAIKLEKSDQAVFLDTLGWVYFKLGQYDEAIKYLQQVVEKAPDVNVFNYHIGMVYDASGDKVKAKLYLEKSLADGKAFKGKEQAESVLKGL